MTEKKMKAFYKMRNFRKEFFVLKMTLVKSKFVRVRIKLIFTLFKCFNRTPLAIKISLFAAIFSLNCQ